MKYEEVLQEIGGFGKYQKWITFLLVLSTVPNGFLMMVSVFVLDSPEHHCRIPDIDKNTTDTLNETETDDWLNKNIPMEKDEYGNWRRSECKRFQSSKLDNEAGNRSYIDCDSGWSHYPQFGEFTAVMEWDLVCDRAWIKPLIISLYMCGVLFGSVVSGIVSDRYGRRPVFLWGTLLQFSSVFITGFSINAWMFAVLMFVSGCTSHVNYVSAFVIATEIVDSSKRALVGSMEVGGFTIGYLLLPVAAYFLTEWKWLMWFMGAGGVIFIPYYWWIPESPRWMILNGKEEANDLIKKISKINGKNLEDEEFIKMEVEVDEETNNEFERNFTYVDLLRRPSIRKRSLIMFFIWFTASLTYFCISLSTSNLGGNKFLNGFTSAAVEIPAYILAYIIMEKFGRRKTLVSFMMIGGIACTLTPFFLSVSRTLMIVCALIGKFMISGIFSMIYIYCCELFPTKMRNMSLGASSTMARVGGIVAPYLIFAGESISGYIPYIMMGSFAIISSLIALLLPETLKVPLPETLQDAVELDRYKLNLCHCSKKEARTATNGNDDSIDSTTHRLTEQL